MKKLIMLFVFILVGCASTPQSSAQGPFLVTGYGKTFELAKDSAFRSAVEFAVGAAVLAERRTTNDELVLKSILSHSSGYVDRYEIISTQEVAGKFTVQMRVYIKPSMIHDYVLYTAKDGVGVNGDRADATINSYTTERNRGDQFVEGVLRDYPEKAYTIKQENFSVKINNDRNFFIYIPYTISLSDKYLMALSDTLAKIQDRKCSAFCGDIPSFEVVYKKPGDYIVTKDKYYFNDVTRPKKVFAQLSQWSSDYEYFSIYKIQVDLYNTAGRTLKRYCVDSQRPPMQGGPNNIAFGITGGTWSYSESIVLPLMGQLKERLKDIDRVELSVVKPNQCIDM
jgi:hypothetical protein